ncbi:glutathione S-transferase family protein [Pacificimonas sp. ICDLI1SI03]
MTVITAFPWVPEFARGLVRDLRIRWALEEIGLPYDVHLLQRGETDSAEYRSWQPFGQVPAYDDGTVRMFESGAILLRIAEENGRLLGDGERGKWAVITWMMAILNTLEPHIFQLASTDIFHKGEGWTAERRPQIVEMVEKRLREIGDALGDKDWLAGEFSIADILFVHALDALGHSEILQGFPRLTAYRDRGRGRPAYQTALQAQLRVFEATEKEMSA